MTQPSRKILVVEDESAQRLMYSRALKQMDYDPTCVANSEEAWKEIQSSEFAATLLDLNLDGESGLDIFEHIREHHPEISVIIATGYGTFDIAKQAIRMDVVDFLSKPVGLDDLKAALDRAWDRHVLVQTPADQLVVPKNHVHERESLNIESMEHDLIIEALRRCKDNRKAAAKMLGISERKLYYRLTQYEVR
jgi:DNA-binding NtrC family response regulator